VSTNRSAHSLSSGDYADVSSVSRSSSGGLRRSVARSQYGEQRQNAEHVNVTSVPQVGDVQHSSVTPAAAAESSRTSSSVGMVVSSTHTTPEFEQQSTRQRRSSSSLFPMLSSRSDSGGRTSATSHRSSGSLFSEDIIDAERAALSRRSDRSSVTSGDRHSTSSTDQTSLFRLPFPQPKRASSTTSATTGQPVHSPPQTASRFDIFGLLVLQILLCVIHCSLMCC